MPKAKSEDIAMLQKQWTTLFCTTLPTLAQQGSPLQKIWPVAHYKAFQRIVFDNAQALGNGKKAWPETPTEKLSVSELQSAISLGTQIANGKANLAQLDEKSLELRANAKKRKRTTATDGDDNTGDAHRVNQHKASAAEMWSTFHGYTEDGVTSETTDVATELATDDDEEDTTSTNNNKSQTAIPGNDDALKQAREKIRASEKLTPFRKHVLTLLTQVPRGHYTTYKAMADAAARIPIPAKFQKPGNNSAPAAKGAAKADTGTLKAGAPRAVGMAMRDNPFAPTVPCHRVLAADGRLGGYKGERDPVGEGRFQQEKRRILREEGVRFDGSGRVVGSPFTAFA